MSLPDITEVEFDSTVAMETSFADYSTHVASAGELSSTVVISLQARGKLEGPQNPRSSSLQNVAGDYYMDLEQESSTVSTGVNPLAVLARFHGEDDIVDRGQELARTEEEVGLRPAKVYSNPVYEIEQTRRSKLNTNGLMLAASSNDNLTLVSRKVLLSPTRSLNLPPTPPSSDNGFSPTQPLLRMTPSPSQLKPPKPKSFPFNIGGRSSSNAAVGSNANQSNANPSDTLLLKLSKPSNIKRTMIAGDSEVEKSEAIQSQFSAGHSVPDQVKEIEASSETVPPNLKRTPVVAASTNVTVDRLKQRYESPSPPTSPHTPTSTTLTPSHTSSSNRRKDSIENSDSGRESMVLEHDTNQNHPVFEPTTITMI